MTNNWTDLANSSCFVVMGANPVENHPASFAHINAARAKGAKLVVIDPRKTRTACQVNPDVGDRFIRIRPGTDIAFLNGVVRRIIEKMDDDADTTVSATQRSKFFEFLNYTNTTQWWTDGSAAAASVKDATGTTSKHTDARFLLKADGTDYDRTRVDASGVATLAVAGRNTISNFPKKAASVHADANTVYNRLKAHVEPYTAEVVADICGCDATEVEFVAKVFIDNSRCSSVAAATGVAQDPTVTGYKALSMLYAMGQTQHTYGSQNVKAFAVIQTLMGNMGRAGGGINALRGIHNVQGSTDMGNLYHLIPFYSGNPTHMTATNATELASESAVLSAGLIQGTQYYGFAEAMIAADGDASGYLVSVLANKVDTVPATMGEALNPARWDILVYRATNIADFSTYTWVGRSDLSSVADTAMGADIPAPGDVCFDGTDFRAYVPAAGSGNLYEFTSADGLTWTQTATVYATSTAVQYPTVVSDGDTTDVYYYDGAGISHIELTVGTAAPGAATQVVAAGMDPAIEFTGGKYVLTYQKNLDGIWQASAAAAIGPFTGVQLYNNTYDSLDGLASAGGKVLFTARTGAQPQNITNKPLRGCSPKALMALNAYGKYADKLWAGFGKPLSGTAGAALMNGSYDAAYNTGDMGWQARGFYNMIYTWFGDLSWAPAAPGNRTLTNALYNLWPKTNGDDHITMFRKAAAGTLGAMVVWGQNPAITEPNQSAVRDGLKNLELLVVVDVFETETAACDRKAGAVTYLIPAASYVEEAGSVTNSGRCLQWRERATKPKGNCKSDLELMFRLAKAFDDAEAFKHITDVWDSHAAFSTYVSAYDRLYGARYGYTPGTNNFYDVTFTSQQVWHGAALAPVAATLDGCEAIAEKIYQEMCKGTSNGGVSWLYNDAYNSTDRSTRIHTGQPNWSVDNRAKSRDNKNYKGQNQYPGWGYSWLVNRRVLYNNGENPGDMSDGFQGPDGAARLFVSTNTNTLNYSSAYRTVHTMADKPDVCLRDASGNWGNITSPHIIAATDGVGADASGNVSFTGRFPGHTEPYETNKTDVVAAWGRNTKGTAKWDLVKSDTKVAGKTSGYPVSNFPFILTTIRCVEHFQGGPITRNNPWNVELEPEPWVEINSLDAAACVPPIKTGDLVQIVTARSNSTTDQNGRTVELRTSGTTADASTFAQGFRARVGVGLAGNQRVGVGVVAIPWHWGDKGLSTGSRANDLCIDAGDANTVIPEYKACLCNIQKI